MLKDKIYKDIKSGLRQLRLRINKNYTVEIPNVAEHGDFSTNAAMLNAKANNMNPRELAEKLVEILAKSKSYKSVEVAGPGFINFKLSKSVTGLPTPTISAMFLPTFSLS